MSDRIEAAARALHDQDNAGNGLSWDDADELTRDRYRAGARAVLTAADTASDVITDYAVRYDAPEQYAGLVANIRPARSLAEDIARSEERHPGGGFKCTVVQRRVIRGEWEPVAAGAGTPGEGDADG